MELNYYYDYCFSVAEKFNGIEFTALDRADGLAEYQIVNV